MENLPIDIINKIFEYTYNNKIVKHTPYFNCGSDIIDIYKLEDNNIDYNKKENLKNIIDLINIF